MERRRTVPVFGLIFYVLSIGGPGQTEASPLLEWNGAPTGSSTFAGRILSTGAASIYYNPAMLLDEGPQVTAGFFYLSHRLRIDVMERPDGVDIEESIYNARQLEEDGNTSRLDQRPIPTAALPRQRQQSDPSGSYGYGVIGVIAPLVEDRLSMGFYGVVPLASFQRQQPFYVDEREQFFSNSMHFERAGDRMLMSAFSFALAIRPLASVDVGVGATLANDASTTSAIYVPDGSDQESSFVNAEIDIVNRVVPHLGVLWRPIDGLRLSATVHTPHYSEVKGRSALRFWNFPYPEGQDALFQDFNYVYGYEPLRVGAGLGYGWGARFLGGEPAWQAAASVLWGRWSQYRDRHGTTPLESWSDTVSYQAGLVHRRAGHVAALDASFMPTPVPDQTGRTNYVDNSRIGAGAGWQVPFAVGPMGFMAGVKVQSQYLLSREVFKRDDVADPVIDEFPTSVDARSGEILEDSLGLRTNNPGFPGYSSGGFLWGAGLSISTVY